MKKTYYQKPATKTVKLSSQHMIAGTGNEDPGGNSRELRRAWKDED